MQFKNAWISSKQHFMTLAEIYRNSSLLRKTTCIFPIPEGFPHLRMLLGICRAPAAFTALGIIELGNDLLRFESTPAPMIQHKLRNIDSSLTFEISRNQIGSVTRYTGSSPFMKHFDIPFIQVNCDASIMQGEFLLCVGGWRMGMLKSKTDELYNHLRSW